MIISKGEARAKRVAKRIGVPLRFKNTDPKYATYRTVMYMEKPLLVPSLEYWDLQPARPYVSKSREKMSKKWASKDKQAMNWRGRYAVTNGSRVWYSSNPKDWSMELTRSGSYIVTCSSNSPVIPGYWVLGVIDTVEYEDCVMREVRAVRRLKSMDLSPEIQTYYYFEGDGIEHMTKSKNALASFRSKVKESILYKLGGN